MSCLSYSTDVNVSTWKLLFINKWTIHANTFLLHTESHTHLLHINIYCTSYCVMTFCYWSVTRDIVRSVIYHKVIEEDRLTSSNHNHTPLIANASPNNNIKSNLKHKPYSNNKTYSHPSADQCLSLFVHLCRSVALSVLCIIINVHLVCDPTIRQPGFDLPRQQWSLLNRFRMEQGLCSACRRKWRLTDTDLCPCGETQMMSHIVEHCPLTKLNSGLSRLHSADEDTCFVADQLWFMTCI